jgi:hypothetical protein
VFSAKDVLALVDEMISDRPAFTFIRSENMPEFFSGSTALV